MNDAKMLRNKVEDFLSRTEEHVRERVAHRTATEKCQRRTPSGTYEALVAAPLDIKQMMLDLLQVI